MVYQDGNQHGFLSLLVRAGHHVIKSLWILQGIFIEFKLRQLYLSIMWDPNYLLVKAQDGEVYHGEEA